MDFSQRSTPQPQPAAHAPSASGPAGASKKKRKGFKAIKLAFVVLLFSTTILAVSLIIYMFVGGTPNEGKFVGKNNFQAVFLNNGQVYFGHIKDLNGKYVRIQNIYYLRQNQSVQPKQTTSSDSNFSLVKLGCEIHGPSDEMIVNATQVTFWENLKSDGQVAKAIDQYVKQNPNGQQCNTSATGTTSNQ